MNTLIPTDRHTHTHRHLCLFLNSCAFFVSVSPVCTCETVTLAAPRTCILLLEQLTLPRPTVTVRPPVDYAPLSQLREGALFCSGSHQEKPWAEIKEETVRLLLKMQASTVSPVTNTTLLSNTTNVTKSKEQILIQSSGAMVAVIVIGIIIILAILLIILKTYNRRTHVSRVLGTNGSKPRQKLSQSTVQSNMPLSTMGVSSVSGSLVISNPASENGFRLPRAELNSVEENHIEQSSTTSGSTVVTIHGAPLLLENT